MDGYIKCSHSPVDIFWLSDMGLFLKNRQNSFDDVLVFQCMYLSLYFTAYFFLFLFVFFFTKSDYSSTVSVVLNLTYGYIT